MRRSFVLSFYFMLAISYNLSCGGWYCAQLYKSNYYLLLNYLHIASFAHHPLLQSKNTMSLHERVSQHCLDGAHFSKCSSLYLVACSFSVVPANLWVKIEARANCAHFHGGMSIFYTVVFSVVSVYLDLSSKIILYNLTSLDNGYLVYQYKLETGNQALAALRACAHSIIQY